MKTGPTPQADSCEQAFHEGLAVKNRDPNDSGVRVRAVYRLDRSLAEAETLARDLAIEQTVEIPDAIIPADIRERVVGVVESMEEGEGHCLATISFAPELADDLFSLQSVAYGNASMIPGVRLVDLRPPRALLQSLRGPSHGIAGVRRRRGVLGRPLLATALKPRGSSHEELARIGHAFARGGGDLVKDDQNLVDPFEVFRQRVLSCAAAVDRANQETGGACLYLPHAGGPAGELERRVEFLAESGIPGVLVCPMLVGLDTVRRLAAAYPLVFMAHPSLTGAFTHGDTQGMDHGVLLGTLFRLAGADISVFPDSGGRFRYPAAACTSIVHRLREPLGDLPSAWPAPAGGMAFEEVESVAGRYGPDSVLLIGGSLLAHPAGVENATRLLLDQLREHFPEVSFPPEQIAEAEPAEPRRLAFREWNWEGRESSPYKDASADTLRPVFRGVRRVELVGKFGERTRCDLRYFEVEPGGHTSLERHVHTHIVIGARGEGILVLGNRRLPLRHLDVACIRPLESHQLRNETKEPFGFLCVVDHDRDRPMPVPDR